MYESALTSRANKSKKSYKIILLGDSGVGKTSIIERYIHDTFDPKQQVFFVKLSQQLELIFWEKPLPSKEISIVCSCGIVPVNKNTGVSSPPTLEMQIVYFLFSTLTVIISILQTHHLSLLWISGFACFKTITSNNQYPSCVATNAIYKSSV